MQRLFPWWWDERVAVGSGWRSARTGDWGGGSDLCLGGGWGGGLQCTEVTYSTPPPFSPRPLPCFSVASLNLPFAQLLDLLSFTLISSSSPPPVLPITSPLPFSCPHHLLSSHLHHLPVLSSASLLPISSSSPLSPNSSRGDRPVCV